MIKDRKSSFDSSSKRGCMKKSIIFLVLCIGLSQASVAGECRAAVRPLLLEQEKDQERIAKIRLLCEREAEAGDADSLFQVSFFYLGLGNWEPEKAIPLIFSAARDGVPGAQYWLGWQYHEGPLLPDDERQALSWYQAAGEQGHRRALNRLADAYGSGDLGVAVDGRKAALLRARAAQCAKNPG